MKLGHVCRAKLGGGPHVEIRPSVNLPVPQTGTSASHSWRPAPSAQPAAHTLVDGRPPLNIEQCTVALATIERLDDPDCSVASSSSTAYVEPSPPQPAGSTALGVGGLELRAGVPEPNASEVQASGQPMVVPLSAVCTRQPSQEDEMAAHRVLLLKKNPAIRREFSSA